MLECVVAPSLVYADFVVLECVARLMVYVARLSECAALLPECVARRKEYVARLSECVAQLLKCVEQLLRSPVWTNLILVLWFAVPALKGDLLKLLMFLKGPDFVYGCLYTVHCLFES